MTKYEAVYNLKYILPDRDRLQSFKDYAVYYINTAWKYSIHWTKEHWHNEALADTSERIADLKSELSMLESIRDELNKICEAENER